MTIHEARSPVSPAKVIEPAGSSSAPAGTPYAAFATSPLRCRETRTAQLAKEAKPDQRRH